MADVGEPGGCSFELDTDTILYGAKIDNIEKEIDTCVWWIWVPHSEIAETSY